MATHLKVIDGGWTFILLVISLTLGIKTSSTFFFLLFLIVAQFV